MGQNQSLRIFIWKKAFFESELITYYLDYLKNWMHFIKLCYKGGLCTNMSIVAWDLWEIIALFWNDHFVTENRVFHSSLVTAIMGLKKCIISGLFWSNIFSICILKKKWWKFSWSDDISKNFRNNCMFHFRSIEI